MHELPSLRQLFVHYLDARVNPGMRINLGISEIGDV